MYISSSVIKIYRCSKFLFKFQKGNFIYCLSSKLIQTRCLLNKHTFLTVHQTPFQAVIFCKYKETSVCFKLNYSSDFVYLSFELGNFVWRKHFMYHVSWEGAGDLNRIKFKVFSIWWGISASVMSVCSNRWKSRFNLSMVFMNTPPSRLNWVFSFPGYIGPFWLKPNLHEQIWLQY